MQVIQQPEPISGQQLKLEGIYQIKNRTNNQSWIEQTLPVLIEYSRTVDTFTSGDFRQAVFVPDPPHWNCWGALFHTAYGAGHIQPTGDYRRSKRAAAHARVLSVWRGV